MHCIVGVYRELVGRSVVSDRYSEGKQRVDAEICTVNIRKPAAGFMSLHRDQWSKHFHVNEAMASQRYRVPDINII